MNTSDSYVRGTLVVDFDAVVQSDQMMYDEVTGTSSTTMTIDSPPERYNFEMGYDAQGLFVYDQVAQTEPTGPDDGVRRVRVRSGRFEVLDAQGLPVTDGSTMPTLDSVFEGAIPLALLDGIAIPTLPASGSSSTSNGSTLSVSSVTTSGSTSVVSSLARTSDPAIPALPQKRTYVKQGADYVLTQIQTDIATTTSGVRMNGKVTLRFENTTWYRNEANNSARQSGSVAVFGTAGGPGEEAPNVMCLDDGTPYPDNCTPAPPQPQPPAPSGCPLTSGGANIVYVHGIKSNGPAWGTASSGSGVVGPVRCAFRIGSESQPSLTTGGAEGTGSHTNQTADLRSHVESRNVSQTIFVAHSQGGLISRRVAQSTWGQTPNGSGTPIQTGRVRAVVTVGTPHEGAPIAKTLNPGPGTNGVVNALTGSATAAVACRIGGCSPIKTGLIALRDGVLAGAFSSPAMSDLRPNSSAINLVRNGKEAFPRYGIQQVIGTRWAIGELAGDVGLENKGVSTRALMRNMYRVGVAASVIGGLASFIPGAAAIAGPIGAAGGFIAHALDSTDKWWTRITVGSQSGDGVVPYASQVYPGAVRNYRSTEPVSHTAEIDSRKSANAIGVILRDNVGVASRT